MKVLSITRSPISITPIRERWYKLTSDTRCLISTDIGCLYYYVHKGFKWDSRSGGILADLIAANIGNQAEMWAYLVHDCNFYGLGLSFETTNNLLKQQLITDAKYGRLRASFIKWCVDVPPVRASFEQNTDEEELNKKLISFQWMNNQQGFMIAQAIDFSNNTHKLENIEESSLEFRRRWSHK